MHGILWFEFLYFMLVGVLSCQKEGEVQRKIFSTSLVVLGIFVLSAFSTGAAQAASACPSNSACIYYNSESQGLNAYYVQRKGTSIADYGAAGIAFVKSPYGATGAGQKVKNNAAAVEVNADFPFKVYYNSAYDCSIACQKFYPFVGPEDLNSTMKNNNASGAW
ncbi:hypothetical protein [Streptomyces sp. NPDC102487]|uniref:hypothetical protein n=1 Tax=Streptomyces sp. NPDC102487 TaxID=3366182 RepID=UPI0037F2F6B8